MIERVDSQRRCRQSLSSPQSCAKQTCWNVRHSIPSLWCCNFAATSHLCSATLPVCRHCTAGRPTTHVCRVAGLVLRLLCEGFGQGRVLPGSVSGRGFRPQMPHPGLRGDGRAVAGQSHLHSSLTHSLTHSTLSTPIRGCGSARAPSRRQRNKLCRAVVAAGTPFTRGL